MLKLLGEFATNWRTDVVHNQNCYQNVLKKTIQKLGLILEIVFDMILCDESGGFSMTAKREDTEEKCKHCGFRKITRSRGLCGPCYGTEWIRQLYPPLVPNTLVRNNVGMTFPDIHNPALMALWLPTNDLPGSKEKLLVLIERAALGLPLWHPLDRPMMLRSECHGRQISDGPDRDDVGGSGNELGVQRRDGAGLDLLAVRGVVVVHRLNEARN